MMQHESFSEILVLGDGDIVDRPTITSGTGSPEGVITAPPGSLYTRRDGDPGGTLYVKESGKYATGWAAK